MELVVVRHAKAEEKSDFTGNDRLRPLVDEGREKMRDVAEALHTLIPQIDHLVASPLVRAQQTAEIIKEEYKIEEIETTETLSPAADRNEFLKFLKTKSPTDTVCIVGHEPDLGELCSWLLSGNSNSFIPFRKSGVCILEFPDTISPKHATLTLKMDPRHF